MQKLRCMIQPVHDNSALFDDAPHPNHDGTCDSEYSRFGVYDCAYTQTFDTGMRGGMQEVLPEPIVISPLSSTSWQTTDLE